jgi:hypothetical protein
VFFIRNLPRRIARRLLFGRLVFDVFDDVADSLQLSASSSSHRQKIPLQMPSQLDDIQKSPKSIKDAVGVMLWVKPSCSSDVLNLLFVSFHHKICSVHLVAREKLKAVRAQDGK